MIFRPCCGVKLRIATIIIAVLHVIGSIVFLILGGLLFAESKSDAGREPQNEQFARVDTKPSNTRFFGVAGLDLSVILLIASSESLLMAMLLFLGSLKQKPVLCRMWVFVNIFFTVIGSLALLFKVISSPNLECVVTVIGFLWSAYCIWIVFAYINELQEAEGVSGLKF